MMLQSEMTTVKLWFFRAVPNVTTSLNSSREKVGRAVMRNVIHDSQK